MFFIRQGATHKVVVGPAVAVGDGFTPVTNLAVSTADEAEAILHDNGTVVDISAGYTFAAIATADGYYHLTLQNAISGTVGHLTIVINDDSLILPLRADFTILDTAAYDANYKDAATGPALATDVTTAHSTTDTLLADIPTVAEFEARTMPNVAYFDPESDTVDIGAILGTNLTETAGQIATAFKKLFDVAAPVLVASDVMVGTNNANTTKTGFSLHGDYDAAKTAAQAGNQMDLVDAPNGTAVTAIQNGLSTHNAAAVWSEGSRALSTPNDYKADVSTLATAAKLLAFVQLMLRSDAGITADNSTELDEINADGGSGIGDYAATAESQEAIPAAVKTAIEADGSKIDHLWETTEDDGGTRRFTADSLAEAPSGTGASATSIREEMDDNSTKLAAIKTKTDLITSANITVTSAVTTDGDIELVQYDDYLGANSKALSWTRHHRGRGPAFRQ